MGNEWRIRFRIQGEVVITPPEPDTARGELWFRNESGGSILGEITVQDTETTLKAAVQLFDAEGAPTLPDDIPQWVVADPNVLTVHPAADGMSATFDVGAPGVSSVTVTTNETHGGVGDPTPIVLTGLVTVIAGDTVSGSVDFATG